MVSLSAGDTSVTVVLAMGEGRANLYNVSIEWTVSGQKNRKLISCYTLTLERRES